MNNSEKHSERGAGIMLASHAGFCFGVRRAVETAASAAPAITLGPIIHNPQMVAALERDGVISVPDTDAVPEGARVVIRSHGVGRSEIECLQKKRCDIRDATCPFVKRIHDMAAEASAADIPVIVIGERAKIIYFRHFLINSAIFWLFFIKIKYIKQKISILLFFIFVIIKQGVDCANIQINIKHK